MINYIALLFCIYIGLLTFTEILFQEPMVALQLKKRKRTTFYAWITPLIKLSKEASEKLQRKLTMANSDLSPEEFIAQGLSKMLILIVLGIFLIINKNYIFGGYLILLSFFLFSRNKKKLNQQVDDIRDEILEELPEFMSYLTNSLKTDKDIKKILDAYKGAASSALENELQKLRADLQTGNIDMALYDFDLRINNTHLSNYVGVVRATLNGETQYATLDSITKDMEQYEYESAKKRAKEIPGKVKRASFAVSVSVILFFLVIMLYALKIGIDKF